MKLLREFVVFLFAFFVVGCATNDVDLNPSPELIYRAGVEDLNEYDYKNAIALFEKVEKESPTSEFAPLAQTKRAYALYLDDKYEDAISTINDFIAQYPLHQNVDYMYYLKGICYYDQILDLGRDQTITVKAIDSLQEVIDRFPASSYARDAKLKIEYATNNLAGKEMNIGHFYLKSGEYVAALNRFETVIEKYQATIFIPEALYRACEIYYYIGDANQAQRYASVLGANYKDTEWYVMAYKLVVEKQFDRSAPWYEGIKQIW